MSTLHLRTPGENDSCRPVAILAGHQRICELLNVAEKWDDFSKSDLTVKWQGLRWLTNGLVCYGREIEPDADELADQPNVQI